MDCKVKFLPDALITTYDTHAQFCIFTSKKRYTPWITSAIKQLITARNKAWRLCKRGGGLAARLRYNALRNSVQNTIRNARYSFYREKLRSCTGSADMWKIVRELGLTSTSESQPMPADRDSFNMHFVGSSNPATLADLRPTARIPPDMRFCFRHVEISDVLEAFSLAWSNALGPDRFPLRHLKECLLTILLFLINIFDSLLQLGHFSSEWQRAIIRPLPRKKSASVISDFRPISILSAAFNILEFAAYKQIDEFVSERGLLDEFQSGFRKCQSKYTALIRIVDEMRKAIDNDCITLLVGIGHTRAFDLVKIKLFIDKLRYSGFSDAANNWIESFLSGRSEVVAFDNGAISALLERHNGVLQGSLLGPPPFSHSSSMTCLWP